MLQENICCIPPARYTRYSAPLEHIWDKILLLTDTVFMLVFVFFAAKVFRCIVHLNRVPIQESMVIRYVYFFHFFSFFVLMHLSKIYFFLITSVIRRHLQVLFMSSIYILSLFRLKTSSGALLKTRSVTLHYIFTNQWETQLALERWLHCESFANRKYFSDAIKRFLRI